MPVLMFRKNPFCNAAWYCKNIVQKIEHSERELYLYRIEMYEKCAKYWIAENFSHCIKWEKDLCICVLLITFNHQHILLEKKFSALVFY